LPCRRTGAALTPAAALSVGFPQRSSRSAPSLGNADLVYGNMMPEGALEKTTHLG